MLKKIGLVLLGLTMFASVASAQLVPEVTYIWTAPIEGSPVAEYTVELNIDSGGWLIVGTTVQPTYTFVNVFEYFRSYEVRVAGKDELGRQGPYSPTSDPYVPDLGVPGAPGKPVIKLL